MKIRAVTSLVVENYPLSIPRKAAVLQVVGQVRWKATPASGTTMRIADWLRPVGNCRAGLRRREIILRRRQEQAAEWQVPCPRQINRFLTRRHDLNYFRKFRIKFKCNKKSL